MARALPFPEGGQGSIPISTVIWPTVDMGAATRNLGEVLSIAAGLPAGTVLFYLNTHRFILDESVAQGCWNLPDDFKENRRPLVLLAPEMNIPIERQQEIVIIDEALPNDQPLESIILKQYDIANLPKPTAAFLVKSVDAIRGLAPFSAEPVVAMRLTNKGLKLDHLWSRKRQTIELSRGISRDSRMPRNGGLRVNTSLRTRAMASLVRDVSV
jgi:hypothetical protein